MKIGGETVNRPAMAGDFLAPVRWKRLSSGLATSAKSCEFCRVMSEALPVSRRNALARPVSEGSPLNHEVMQGS